MAKNSAQLVLKEFSGFPEITPDAYALKQNALSLARAVSKVETSGEQTEAVEALRELKAVLNGMESTRKAVKKPVIELGRKIDNLAHGFTAEIEKQFGRLQGLINHYQKKQLREQREQEKEIEKEQATAAELRHEADIARAAGKFEEAESLEARAFDLEMNAEVAVVATTEKPRGLVVRNKINFQVLDAIVFAQAWPQFWKWHEDTETLKLDRMRILDELNREDQKGVFHMTRFPEELSKTDDPRLVQPAGLRVYEETKSHVR